MHTWVAIGSLAVLILAIITTRQSEGPGTDSYDASGAVYPQQMLASITQGYGPSWLKHRQHLLAHCQRLCTSAAPFAAESHADALRHFALCGWAVVGPGLLPQLDPQWRQQMLVFVNTILQNSSWEFGSVRFSPDDVLPPEHAPGRGDMWPPPHPALPFGKRMLDALTGLSVVLQPLLGTMHSLDFVSLLYVRNGAKMQLWHGEGTFESKSQVMGLNLPRY